MSSLFDNSSLEDNDLKDDLMFNYEIKMRRNHKDSASQLIEKLLNFFVTAHFTDSYLCLNKLRSAKMLVPRI